MIGLVDPPVFDSVSVDSPVALDELQAEAAAGLWAADRFAAIPPWQFTTGTASAVLPAVYAATRDPVRVLRTP